MSPVDYLILNVRHRTNEDWVLDLLISVPVETLAGATAKATLYEKARRRTVNISCTVDPASQTIKTRLQSDYFTGMEGVYVGDVKLVLASGQSMVTHVINLELLRGIS